MSQPSKPYSTDIPNLNTSYLFETLPREWKGKYYKDVSTNTDPQYPTVNVSTITDLTVAHQNIEKILNTCQDSLYKGPLYNVSLQKNKIAQNVINAFNPIIKEPTSNLPAKNDNNSNRRNSIS